MDNTSASSPAPGPIVAFYRGRQPDSEGRFIDQVRAWHDDRLEFVHDYIQWLFPTRQRSQFNPDAPILDDDQIREFRSDAALRASLIASFERMAAFYGFEVVVEPPDTIRVRPSAEWSQRKRAWMTPGNHNLLRITRILSSLKTLGLANYAHAFWEALTAVAQSEGTRIIGDETRRFWRNAVTNPAE